MINYRQTVVQYRRHDSNDRQCRQYRGVEEPNYAKNKPKLINRQNLMKNQISDINIVVTAADSPIG